MGRLRALSAGRRLLPWTLIVALAGALPSCKTGQDALRPSVERDGRETGPRQASPAGDTWFAVETASCEAASEAVVTFSRQPGVIGPKGIRTQPTGGWCAVVPLERASDRADGLAQNVSSLLSVTALSFYIADGRWSYTVYDAGNPVAAMESHYGDSPVVIGDVERASRLLGLPQGVLRDYQSTAGEPDSHQRLALSVGVSEPSASAPPVDIAALVAEANSSEVAIGDPGPMNASRFDAGSWVVMPPMGVLLVKGIEAREVEGSARDYYLVVDGPTTIEVPVDGARRMGMRRVASTEVADKLLAEMDREIQVDNVSEYVEARVRGYLTALSNGRLADIARGHRELCTIRDARALYSHEAGMLDNIRQWLAEELSVATKVTPAELEARLHRACE